MERSQKFACRVHLRTPEYARALDVSADDEDRFRLRPGVPRARQGPATTRFVGRVLRATQRAGPNPLTGRSTGRDAGASRQSRATQFARGQVAARLLAGTHSRHTRRVVIKARLVNLRQASPKSCARHLRYIERD